MALNLEHHVGKNIRSLCNNGFVSDGINHCAHFVSHALSLDFSYCCKEHTGGSEPGANIRVHEIFQQCPLVGPWSQADTTRPLLVFVTRKEHVNLGRKEMVNHPQKHIGIYHNGKVYHYSNTKDKVVKQDIDTFYTTFERIYSGTQGLFFGQIPGSDLNLNVDLSASRSVRGRSFLIKENDGHYTASADGGDAFYVGRSVRYHSRRGLFHPASRYYGPVYSAEDYHARYDHWATVLEVIGACEGQNHFNLINSYDRAAFTFGFMQFAAHTPNDNLILLMRELLRLSDAKDYFPELELRNDRVHRIDKNGSATNLEVEESGELRRFMTYLNPGAQAIDDQELLHAARMIHWANSSAGAREAQVKVAIEITSKKVIARYHRWYNLLGASDLIVTIIADIHHQGRASRATVQEALSTSNPIRALLRVNHAQWSDRNLRLEAITKALVEKGRLGIRVYDPANNLFIDPKRPLDSEPVVVPLPVRPPEPLPVSPPAPPNALRVS